MYLQIVKTLRYSFRFNGWTNKIGLRNKGLKYGLKHYNPNTDIISIAILKNEEIPKILKLLPTTTNIELNVSCPNLEKSLIGTSQTCKHNYDQLNNEEILFMKPDSLDSVEIQNISMFE